MSSYFSGAGSYPPEKRGLHLKILRMPSHTPMAAPRDRTASIMYCEQDGRNLHLEGKSGEMHNL